DADRADAPRQRPLLRLARRGPPALHHPGAGYDPARPQPAAAGLGRGEGRSARGGRRGPGDRRAARLGHPAPPPGHGGGRRGGGVPPTVRRLLPHRLGAPPRLGARLTRRLLSGRAGGAGSRSGAAVTLVASPPHTLGAWVSWS